jgi:hypothetical protein
MIPPPTTATSGAAALPPGAGRAVVEVGVMAPFAGMIRCRF